MNFFKQKKTVKSKTFTNNEDLSFDFVNNLDKSSFIKTKKLDIKDKEKI